MKFSTTNDLSSSIYADALAIRKEVFVNEQKVDESLEIDEFEEVALHVVGYIDNQAACTARVIEKENEILKIQRVAVSKDFRKRGLGLALLQEIEKIANETFESKKMQLDAQDHAIPFYEKNGFTTYGEGFMDTGIPHHHMEKRF